MATTYAFGYDPTGVYGRIVSLINGHAAHEGVHLDIGCGFGAIAEPLAESGLTYVGLDFDPAGPEALRERGFESGHVDLQDLATLEAALSAALGQRQLASISLIDTLEHITNGPEVLTLLRSFAIKHGPVPLIVSVPNATHVDVAIKLLTGRWDWTDSGLLDRTHIAFYSAKHLDAVMGSVGWSEVDRDDYRLSFSDQHFPSDSIALSRDTNLGTVLHAVRTNASDDENVNQFVRAYLPGSARNVALVVDRELPPELFLTVVMRTQGRRIATLRDALLCLDAQTCDDFEVVLVVHQATQSEQAEVAQAVADQPERLSRRITIIQEPDGERGRPLNTGIQHARGRYLAMLGDDDLVFAHWVDTFFKLATAFPGRQLRTVAIEQDIQVETWPDAAPGIRTQGPYRAAYPDRFDLLAHTVRNYTPLVSWAFPRQLFQELGFRFDETLPICEDWELILRGASVCGVADVAEATCVYRRWTADDESELLQTAQAWLDAAATVGANLDRQPVLLQPGYFLRLRQAMQGVDPTHADPGNADPKALRQLVIAQAARIEALESSTSWRITRPLRTVSARLHRG